MIKSENHEWLSYISHSGVRRYVAWRVINGEKYGSIDSPNASAGSGAPAGSVFGAPPTQQTTPSSGKFYANNTIAIRDKASVSGKVVGTYRPGESFVYDKVIKSENHEWLSYISHSGARRYVAWRIINGPKYGAIS